MPDANGYVVYVNNTAYSVTESDSISITIDGLIPGTSYSIVVRASLDTLGPISGPLIINTANGKYQ